MSFERSFLRVEEPRHGEEEERKGCKSGEIAQKDGADIAHEQDGLEKLDEPSRREKERDNLERTRHVLDFVEEAGQQKDGHERDDHRNLRRKELRLGGGGYDEPERHLRKKEERRSKNRQCNRTAQGDAEDEARRSKADGESHASEEEVVDDLRQDDLQWRGGRRIERFERSMLVFLGHLERGQHAADERQHQHHDARHEMPLRVVRVVVPDANAGRTGASPIHHGNCRVLIRLRDGGRSRIDGNGRRTAVLRQKETRIRLAPPHQILSLLRRSDDTDAEAIGRLEPADKFRRRCARSRLDDGKADVLDVHRERKAENRQQHGGKHHADQEERRLAEHEPQLLLHQHRYPPQVHGFASLRLMRVTNASSRLSDRPAARMSAGEPCATAQPSCMMIIRSQNSASSR